MDLSKVEDALKTGDEILRNVVPISRGIVDKVRKNSGGWGYEVLLQTPIENYCLVDMGDWQMRKAMFLNLAEKDITLDLVADSVTGISNKVSDEAYKYDYSYAQENNYLNTYQREAKHTTTKEGYTSDNIQNYRNHNQLYGESVNVYPDEDNTGRDNFTIDKKWDFYNANRNRNSIIYKTKKLFDERKINTIISRFHTDPDNLALYDGTEAKTQYGLSHGRNLLTYDAERNRRSYDRNGYDNPYCRVWTHHHQYSDLRGRLMRPFSVEDENGNFIEKTNHAFHNWPYFPDAVKTRWGWKDSGSDGWKKSVLDKNTGLVNITPKYLGGAEKNIHTKDCMFSIENLAWQGYDPYSFERALSWEQRGPFGGRIMWFPPYGLRFSEDASVSWNEHSFIGRGENVFTYTNTSRSGTLEFMMVVDHPSILDYSTWYGNETSNDVNLPKDTDVLRFFAGCDGGSSDGIGNQGLNSYAKPTPLTDEYLQEELPQDTVPVTEKAKPEPKTPTEPEIPSPDEEIELSFYVFFPNNYSGAYDNNADSKVNPIAYLLCGNGTQWKCNMEDVTKSEVLPLSFNNIGKNDPGSIGNGYEMSESGSKKTEQDLTNNFIIGTSPNWRYYKASKYVQYNNKRWYYRIDGDYKIAKGGEQYKNTFDQTLRTENSYLDMRTSGLNYDVKAVKTQFPEEKDNENLYTLAEIAYALCNNYDNDAETPDQNFINMRTGNSIDRTDERMKNLIEMLDTRDGSVYKVIGLYGIGYSNSHGSNKVSEINIRRNDFLAEQRCKTVLSWFKDNYGYGSRTIETGSEISKPSVLVDKKDLQDESGDSAKRWRSAKITIKVKKSAVVKPEEMNHASETETGEQAKETFERFTNFEEVEVDTDTGTQLYINLNEQNPDKKNRRWYYDEKDSSMKTWDPEYKVHGRWNNPSLDAGQSNENSLRYDQEYHFFKKLEATHPDVFTSLVQKLQYFDPAFHSMTPEGFMGRLNFLHQCTRQGDTISVSDKNGRSANNLAFGRPPFCILRLGDFYYQKIVIRNINITYDPLVLDLNNEGIGVVPLIANVTISFNFIGGGDLSGPVRRLQNAMSFNYYANGRLYDNRADRVERQLDMGKNLGTMGNGKVNFDSSYFHHVRMAK